MRASDYLSLLINFAISTFPLTSTNLQLPLLFSYSECPACTIFKQTWQSWP